MDREMTEIDHSNLREMLSSLLSDLSVSYLEKRARSSSHKANPLDELSDVIQELSQRERELQAAAGIANFLLDNNEILQGKHEELIQQLRGAKEKIGMHKQKIRTLKYEILEHEKIKVEEAQDNIIALTNENERLVKRLNSLKEDINSDLLDQYKHKVNELKNNNSKHINELNSTIASLQENIKYERSCKDKLTQKLNKKTAHNKELKAQNSKMEEDSLKLRNKINQIRLDCAVIEESNDRLNDLNEDYKEKMAKLKNKIKVMKIILSKNESSAREYDEETTQEASSLKSELQEIENLHVKEASICSQNSTLVNPSYKRKSPSEEYFQLTAQAIFLNSPYIEAISNIPIKDLYVKAVEKDIPFHQWHTWIENQLNSAYIQKIYKDYGGFRFN